MTALFLTELQQKLESDLFVRSVIASLDRLALMNQLDIIIESLEMLPELDLSNTDKKRIAKLFANITNSAVNNSHQASSLIRIAELLRDRKVEMSAVVFNKILEVLNKNFKDTELFESVIQFMKANDVEFTLPIYNTIIDFYSNSDQISKAIEVFNGLGEETVKPDSYTYSILLRGIKNDDEAPEEALEKLYEKIISDESLNVIILFNNLLDVCINKNHIEKVHALYDIIIEREELVPDQITFNTLIKNCCKNKDFINAVKYFGEMKKHNITPNRITYNTIMDLAVKAQNLKYALNLIEEMKNDEIVADGYTYSIILNGLKINSSPVALVKASTQKLKEVIEDDDFKLDEVLFNSIIDVCSKYKLDSDFEYFYEIMLLKGINESFVTYSILLKYYTDNKKFAKLAVTLDKLLKANIQINDSIFGSILDSCIKAGSMDSAMKIYKILAKANLHANSIIFTTMLKGFIKFERYQEGIYFFKDIKQYKKIPGMIITFNCGLDMLVRNGDIDAALELFKEIDTLFKADLISYSTIIKGLCATPKKEDAFIALKDMINNSADLDISVVNLFLDSCANKKDFKYAIQAYQYIMMKNIKPNEVTFGIMVKIYGFSRELHKAFDLLDLMMVYEITPSIIVYTNLVHISFYCNNPKKADLAFTLFKKQGMKGDRLLYSKIIDGMTKYKDYGKIEKYLNWALKDKSILKKNTMDKLFKLYEGYDDTIELLKKISKINYVERTENKEQRVKRLENGNNYSSLKYHKSQKQVNKNREEGTQRTGGNREFKTRGDGFKKKNSGQGVIGKPKMLFNFRNK